MVRYKREVLFGWVDLLGNYWFLTLGTKALSKEKWFSLENYFFVEGKLYFDEQPS